VPSNPDEVRFGSGVVQQLLPQRPPMLMVDGVEQFVPGPRPLLRAFRAISSGEPWLSGHFPGLPVWPGALIIEGIAQAGGLLRTLVGLEAALRDAGASVDALAALVQNLDRGFRLDPRHQPEQATVFAELSRNRSAGIGVLGAVQIKLLRPVVPGERLVYQLVREREFEDLWHCGALAEVEGEPVAKGSVVIGRRPAISPVPSGAGLD
jgi:3-hydroxymyristoyl/3-hydroxydecanoyl-(acyl carrier protein) dehydratase